MSDIDGLARAYGRFVSLPWSESLAHQQRVWMVVYPPRDERRMRARLPNFEVATTKAGHDWLLVDLTHIFGKWLASHEYMEAYFEDPEFLSSAALEEFGTFASEAVVSGLSSPIANEQAVVALVGVGALFPFFRVSRLLDAVSEAIRGRLVVFFPGERDESNYRLLEARDGWNYLATPITMTEEAL